MGWNIGSSLSSAWHKVTHVAESAADAVVDEGKKLGSEALDQGKQLAGDAVSLTGGLIDKILHRSDVVQFPHELNVPTPETHTSLQPGKRTPVPDLENLTLGGSKTPVTSFGLHMDQAGDARLDLNAAGPGTDWGKKDAESAVLSVYVDGKYQQDVVLFGGDKTTPYALSLGNLPAGDHTITLRYAREKSSEGAKGIAIASGSAEAVTYASKEEEWAAKYAPILIGRGSLDNNHTDTPLGMYHEVKKNEDGTTTLSYSYAYSNEDRGTAANPALEAARWGRLTDLQHVMTVTVDANGNRISETIEGNGHKIRDFAGEHDGTHPVIKTSSGNNNVSDEGDGSLRFRMTTDNPLSPDMPTEDLMRTHPEWFEIMGKELLREGKVDPSGVGDKPNESALGKAKIFLAQHGLGDIPQMADPRNYLYVQFKASGAEEHPVSVRVRLKNGQVRTSDMGVDAAKIARDGWAQTTVQLPPGTRPEDVAGIEYVSDGAKIEEVGHTYMLDQEYAPVELPKPAVS